MGWRSQVKKLGVEGMLGVEFPCMVGFDGVRTRRWLLWTEDQIGDHLRVLVEDKRTKIVSENTEPARTRKQEDWVNFRLANRAWPWLSLTH
jgi:hypothetical protein